MSRSVCQNCGHDSESCDFKETVRRATEMIAFKKIASSAMLQHELKINYATSAKIIEQLEEEGLIGPAVGTEPRMISPKLFSSVDIVMPKNDLACPMCGTYDVAEIIYGEVDLSPGSELSKSVERGEIIVGGCDMPIYIDENGNRTTPGNHCNKCSYEWATGNEQLGLYAENEDDCEDEEE